MSISGWKQRYDSGELPKQAGQGQEQCAAFLVLNAHPSPAEPVAREFKRNLGAFLLFTAHV